MVSKKCLMLCIVVPPQQVDRTAGTINGIRACCRIFTNVDSTFSNHFRKSFMVISTRGFPSESSSIIFTFSMIISVFGEETAPSLPMERSTFTERIYHIHALSDLTESGILSVQKTFIAVADEELAGGAVRIIGSCHGYHATCVGKGILYAVLRELTLNGICAAAGTVTLRVTALRHEVLYHTVEFQTVIKAVLDQLFKILTGDRCNVRIQGDYKGIISGAFCLQNLFSIRRQPVFLPKVPH